MPLSKIAVIGGGSFGTVVANIIAQNGQIIIEIIEQKDSGDGVGVDEIILESGIENCEKIINNLLEEGEIFEIRPGTVKVL